VDRGADRSLRIAREINSVEGLKELRSLIVAAVL